MELSNEETVKEQPMVNEPDEPLQEVLPPATPPSPQHATNSPARGSLSFGEGSSSESIVQRGPIKMRSLRKIYEQIEENEEANLFCLYADYEPLSFQEAEEKDCWRSTMKDEIHAIRRTTHRS